MLLGRCEKWILTKQWAIKGELRKQGEIFSSVTEYALYDFSVMTNRTEHIQFKLNYCGLCMQMAKAFIAYIIIFIIVTSALYIL
jgi:hypothetical protein